MVEKPLYFKITRTGFIDSYPELVSDSGQAYLIKGLMHYIFLECASFFVSKKDLSIKQIEALLSRAFELLEPIENVLERFDIEGLRVNKNYNVVYDRNREEFSVENLFLEFKVDGQWLPFSHLSDGTRRLFYIVSEICFPGLFRYRESRVSLSLKETNKIVLIEEPELGLHPGHLDTLMQVLQESSGEHQIIVTTHAPQLLDVLGKEELNKIIIARLSKNGTTLRRLTEQEQEKARLYMEEEAYLSDYWRFSDLEE